MSRQNRAIFSTSCVLCAVLYSAPFFLEKTARRHMMFYRYLVVKQRWWLNEMLSWRLSLTVAAVLLIIVCALWAAKRKKFFYPLPCRILNIFCLSIAIIVMNINPYMTLVHFLLLFAGGSVVILSFLTTAIIMIRGDTK